MIKRISKLKNCGIFRDFKWDNALPEFDRYNLFYGLNGSGKSTLSQALSFFSTQINDKGLGEYEIEIVESSGVVAGNKTINQNPIYVFNKEFIQKNIDSQGKLDEIIYLSEENIEAKTRAEELKVEIEKLKAKKEITQKTYIEKKKNFEKLAPNIALKIKTFFVALGGLAAQRYSNFDKRGIEAYYSANKAQLEIDIPNCDAEIERLKIALKESTLPIVDIKIEKANSVLINRAISNALELLKKSVKKDVASKYSNEILNWIERGLTLHVDNKVCSFCGGIISDERTVYLKQLFSEQYKLFIAQIELAIKELEALTFAPIDFNIVLYDESKTKVEKAVVVLNGQIIKLNKFLAKLACQLIEKKAHIEKIDFEDLTFDEMLIDSINAEIETIEKCIQETNSRTKNFTKKQGEELENLKNLLIYKYMKQGKYICENEDLNDSALKDKTLEASIQDAENRKSDIESRIRDVFIAAKEFNNLLHQFLGRQEISLEFDESLKGYKLIRENKKAERLSDGEKTAITFIYFLTKIRENGNKIENTIVVLDDPISSLDSNNIFNAFAFIMAMFDISHQFFVLTHNFTFFSLLKRKIGKELKKGNNMYLIENTYKQVGENRAREAKIIKLPPSLKELNSDYAFSFKCIKETIDSKSVIADLNEYFVLSNNCRKVLETFCSFKLINEHDFKMETVKNLYKLNNSDLTIEEKAEAEKIFRFVNYYSHGGKFSIISEIDGIIGEALHTAQSVIKLIERADKTHYDQLIQAISKSGSMTEC